MGGAALKLARFLNFETVLIDSSPTDQLEYARQISVEGNPDKTFFICRYVREF